MLLAFKKNSLYSGSVPYQNRLDDFDFIDTMHIENVITAILDGQCLKKACLCQMAYTEKHYNATLFNNVSYEDFIHHFAHELNPIAKLPNNQQKDTEFNLVQLTYILFDLDDGKIYIPNYDFDKSSIEFRTQPKAVSIGELYKLLKHFLRGHKYHNYALKNNLMVCDSPVEPYRFFGEYNLLYQYGVLYRALEVGSKPFKMFYSECCKQVSHSEITCSCTDEDKSRFLNEYAF